MPSIVIHCASPGPTPMPYNVPACFKGIDLRSKMASQSGEASAAAANCRGVIGGNALAVGG